MPARRHRPANRHLDAGDVRSILRQLSVGATVAQCARTHACDPKTIRNVRAAGTTARDAPKPRRTNPAIVKRRKKAVELAVKEIKCSSGRRRRAYPSCLAIARELRVSTSTVRRDLRESGLVSRVRPKRPRLDYSDCQTRKQFAGRMLRVYTLKEREHIAFSDEKLFDTNDHGNNREWRHRHQEANPRVFEKWAPKVMVWGVIGVNYRKLHFFERGEKVDAPAYQNAIKKALPEIRRRGFLFQQDGARSHTAATTTAFLKRRRIVVLDGFPPRSPDLNPIEHMWALVQKRLMDHYEGDLEKAVRDAWEAVPTKDVNSLVCSFSRRLAQTKAKNGRFVK